MTIFQSKNTKFCPWGQFFVRFLPFQVISVFFAKIFFHCFFPNFFGSGPPSFRIFRPKFFFAFLAILDHFGHFWKNFFLDFLRTFLGRVHPSGFRFWNFFWPMTRPMMSSATSFWIFVNTSYRLGVMLRTLWPSSHYKQTNRHARTYVYRYRYTYIYIYIYK